MRVFSVGYDGFGYHRTFFCAIMTQINWRTHWLARVGPFPIMNTSMDPPWDTLRRGSIIKIVGYLQDIRYHLQLLLDERIVQRQRARSLQGFFAPPHYAAVLDVFEQYCNPGPVILVECQAYYGNEVLKNNPRAALLRLRVKSHQDTSGRRKSLPSTILSCAL